MIKRGRGIRRAIERPVLARLAAGTALSGLVASIFAMSVAPINENPTSVAVQPASVASASQPVKTQKTPAEVRAAPSGTSGAKHNGRSNDQNRNRISDDLEKIMGTSDKPVRIRVRYGTDPDSLSTVARNTRGIRKVKFIEGTSVATMIATPAAITRLAKASNVMRVESDLIVKPIPIDMPEPQSAGSDDSGLPLGIDLNGNVIRSSTEGTEASGTALGYGKAQTISALDSDLATLRSQLGLTGDADGNPYQFSTKDVAIAIIDTGINESPLYYGFSVGEPIPTGKVLLHKDFTERDPSCETLTDGAWDDTGHGTHVASIAAGLGGPWTGGMGVAPGASLIDLKVFDCKPYGRMSWVDAALGWVITNHEAYNIRVVNMSLGASVNGDGTDSTSRLVNKLQALGVNVVIAAGNSGPRDGTIGTPAVAEHATTVGAGNFGANGEWITYFSSSGPTADGRPGVDIVAPGYNIYAQAKSGIEVKSGTSMASPFVAGLYALFSARNPSARPSGVICDESDTSLDCQDGVIDSSMGNPSSDTIKTSALDVFATGPDSHSGSGFLDAATALASAAGTPWTPSLSSGGGTLHLDSGEVATIAVSATTHDAGVTLTTDTPGYLPDLQWLKSDGREVYTGLNLEPRQFYSSMTYASTWLAKGTGTRWLEIRAARAMTINVAAVADRVGKLWGGFSPQVLQRPSEDGQAAIIRLTTSRALDTPANFSVRPDSQLSSTSSGTVIAGSIGAHADFAAAAVDDSVVEGDHFGLVVLTMDESVVDRPLIRVSIPIVDNDAGTPERSRVLLDPTGGGLADGASQLTHTYFGQLPLYWNRALPQLADNGTALATLQPRTGTSELFYSTPTRGWTKLPPTDTSCGVAARGITADGNRALISSGLGCASPELWTQNLSSGEKTVVSPPLSEFSNIDPFFWSVDEFSKMSASGNSVGFLMSTNVDQSPGSTVPQSRGVYVYNDGTLRRLITLHDENHSGGGYYFRAWLVGMTDSYLLLYTKISSLLPSGVSAGFVTISITDGAISFVSTTNTSEPVVLNPDIVDGFLSPNSRFLVVRSMVIDPALDWNPIYVRDLTTGITRVAPKPSFQMTLVGVSNDGSPEFKVKPDDQGGRSYFPPGTKLPILRFNMSTGGAQIVGEYSESFSSDLEVEWRLAESPGGTPYLFGNDPDLVSGDTNGQYDLIRVTTSPSRSLSPPTAPIHLAMEQLGEGRVRVSWDATSPTDTFLVKIEDGTGLQMTWIDVGSATSIILEDEQIRWSVNVVAVRDGIASTETHLDFQAKSVPNFARVTSITLRECSAVVSAHSESFGTALFSFQVSADNGPWADWTIRSIQSDSNRVLFLPSGHSYRVRVNATDINGTSAWSPPSLPFSIAANPTCDSTYQVTISRNGTGSGTVTSNPSGINCGSTCSTTFDYGTTVTLTATPATGSTFTGWTGACSGTGACVVSMDRARNVTATFARLIYMMSISISGSGSGTITSNPSGINCGSTCSTTFDYGTTVTLTATPATGSTFTGWTGACSGTGACVVLMDQIRDVGALFTVITNTLTITTNGLGQVTTSPTGNACGPECLSFTYGTEVTLTASPSNTDWVFTGWSGACSGTSTTCTVTMDQARNVTASFGPLIIARIEGTGSGTITSSPSGITCSTVCLVPFPYNTEITLTATPATGSTFTGWSGGTCTDTSTTCVITADQLRDVTALFTVVTNTLTITTNGSGRVTISPSGNTCGGGCLSFTYGTEVTLTATPATGSTFTGWTGGTCSGNSTTCVVTMDQARTVTASFTVQMSTSRSGTGSGTITSAPSGIDCGSTCSTTFTYGSEVTLTATPATGSTFTGWTGACSGNSTTCVVTMGQDHYVNAIFSLETYQVTISKSGTGSGTITSGPAGINCGLTCTASYGYGTTIFLTATPTTDSVFTGWTGACSGTGVCMVLIDQSLSVVATFAEVRLLTVQVDGGGKGVVYSYPSGISCSSCSRNFERNSEILLTALPGPGSIFLGWSGACEGNGSCVVTMTDAQSVTATFSLSISILFGGVGSGSVSSSPEGLDCSSNCRRPFDYGTVVTLTATPATGSVFTGWAGPCSGTGTCVVTMDQAQEVVPFFGLQTRNLSVATLGGGTISISPQGIGDGCGLDCSSFLYGTVITLVATPTAGWQFTGWAGACSGTDSCVITLQETTSAIASFERVPKTLFINPSGTGTGSVVSSPSGIDCTSSCSATFTHGTVVTLVATAAVGSSFAGWFGACSGTGSCAVTMDDLKSVYASFTINHFFLVVKTGGSGVVTSTPSLVNCTSTCTYSLAYGTTLTLSASPGSKVVFTEWSGACSGAISCSITATDDLEVTALFSPDMRDLVAAIDGNGSGRVRSTPSGINCTSSCSSSFLVGDVVELTAFPGTGTIFVGWSGLCTGTETCTLTMDQDRDVSKLVTATFALEKHTLIITTNNYGKGVVFMDASGTICRTTCSLTFDYGTVVNLYATPDTGSEFGYWAGSCPSVETCQVTMTQDRTVSAVFGLTKHQVEVTVINSGSGTVESSPEGLLCQSLCIRSFEYDTVVTLTATPGPGAYFHGWTGACASFATSICTVTITQATKTAAIFWLTSFTLNLGLQGAGTGQITIKPLPLCDLCGYETCTTACGNTYEYGTLLTIQAIPDSNSQFVEWTGTYTSLYDCAALALCQVRIDKGSTMTATFSRRPLDLDITLSGKGRGWVTSPVLECFTSCIRSVGFGSSVTLSAPAVEGSVFVGWTGACEGLGECTITMSEGRSVVATFSPITYTLTLSNIGQGTGSVTSSPEGIACGSLCVMSFETGTVVTLSARPDLDYYFGGWTDKHDSCGGASICQITIREDLTIQFSFNLPKYSLNIYVRGNGSGSVIGTPLSEPCTRNCFADVTRGTSFTLTATPQVGSKFSGWTGSCTGTGVCEVNMNSMWIDVYATFVPDTHTLNTTLSGTGAGLITSTPAGINCGSACRSTYEHGTTLTLAVTPTAGSTFSGWSGACSGTGTCQVTMTGARDVTANFTLIPATPPAVPKAPVVNSTPPGAPKSPKASAGKKTASLTWTAPASAGSSTVTKYRVEYSLDKKTWKTATTSAPLSRTYLVKGLSSGKTYWFRIAATSSAGTGGYSSSVSARVR